MQVTQFMKEIHALGIKDYIGVPDSTLKCFCDYLNLNISHEHHFVPVNEGAAVALAAGMYLGNDSVSCVYMQNSGIGNAINPIASLINEKVYDIPMLFLVGYRGEPGIKDEPQHKFQGEITVPLLDCLAIKNVVISKDTTTTELQDIFQVAKAELAKNRQFAIVIKKDTFDKSENYIFDNQHSFNREEAIHEILKTTKEDDIIVSTTGKISREVYEQCDQLFGNHKRTFLTVGSMGHASMIALGIAKKNPKRNVFCIDGDGAALMHMGSMAFIAHQSCENLLHITLNNEAHESVGGMPTDCYGTSFHDLAKVCGYHQSFLAKDKEELQAHLHACRNSNGLAYIEVQVSLGARSDLGRPKETAVENKIQFMEHVKEWR